MSVTQILAMLLTLSVIVNVFALASNSMQRGINRRLFQQLIEAKMRNTKFGIIKTTKELKAELTND